MLKRSRRTLVVTALAALLVLGLSSLVAASETTVSTQAVEPGRQLEVLDLAGNDLEHLRLRDGRPQPFEVRVTDTDQGRDDDFTVATTMNNLHLVDGEGHDAERSIASEHVELSFPGNPLAALGVHADLEPRYLLGTAAPVTCSAVDSLLVLGGTLLGDDPLCELLASLHDLSLVDDLDGEALAFDGVEVVRELLEDIDLDSLDLPALPLVPGHGTAGAYEDPDCGSGIGSAFCDGTTPTVRQALRADANDQLVQALEDLLLDAVGDGELVGPDGLLAVEDVLAALKDSDEPLVDGDGDDLGDTVASFGDALVLYDADDQIELINGLLEGALRELALDDLLHVTGRYSSYPALTVDTGSAPAGGAYEGTLTVTLIE